MRRREKGNEADNLIDKKQRTGGLRAMAMIFELVGGAAKALAVHILRSVAWEVKWRWQQQAMNTARQGFNKVGHKSKRHGHLEEGN